MDEKRLGEVVQAARRKAGLTQQGLCQKSGLSYSTLAKIERGAIKSPSVFTIQRIAGTLGIGLDELLSALPSKEVPGQSKKVSKNGARFVYFDMNGCLVRFYNRAFTRLADQAGVSTDVVESVFWHYNDEVCRGDTTVDVLNTALAERLNVMVDWQKYYLESVEATPGVAELVQWVAENYRLGLMTNTMPGLVSPMLDSGLLPKVTYDAIIDSSQVHALKPEIHMFEIAAERSGVAQSEILLIDDDRPNLIAAEKLGWRTTWFDAYQPEESIAKVREVLEPAN
ncbi:MAG: HAD-IA family hydrolase [Candidatus Saccharimonadales bacterium]